MLRDGCVGNDRYLMHKNIAVKRHDLWEVLYNHVEIIVFELNNCNSECVLYRTRTCDKLVS